MDRDGQKLMIDEFIPQEGVPIQIMRREPQVPYEMHSHEFAELVIVTGGQGIHIMEDLEYSVAAGDVFVISGSYSHGYTKLRNLHLINIIYDPQRLPIPELDIRQLPGYHALFTLEPQYRQQHRFESRLHLSLDELRRVQDYVSSLEHEIVYQEPGSVFMATAVFMQLIGYLARHYSRSTAPAAESLIKIAEVISHMETNYHETITLDELARMAKMSKSSLLRAFRRGLGVSPIDYLLSIRIHKAEELLKETSLAITDIAFDAGFADSNYFSRQFRKQLGISPREYRRRADVR